MPILDVHGLTMRFGGLTAVNKVDFAVEPGQIFSIIGPNGAGKTTVFNAVTGVYEPTEGRVLFGGQDVRLPFRRRVALGVALIGLLTGVGLALFSSNVDALWRAVIIANYADPSEPFPAGKAAGDFFAYLQARVLNERVINRTMNIERKEKGGKHLIRSTSNKAVLETYDDAETAERRREIVESLVNLAGSLRTTTPGSGRWLVRTPAGATLHDDEASARAAAQNAAAGTPVERAGAPWYVLGAGGQVLQECESREKARALLTALAVTAGKIKWRLYSRAAPLGLGFAATEEQADREARAIEETIALGPTAVVEEREGKAVVLAADRSRELARCDSRADADERLAELAVVGRSMAAARALTLGCLLVGALLGAGGAFVVWSRARRTPDVIARSGLARTFQNIRLFPDMLVVENVLIGMDARLRSTLWASALHTAGFRAEEAAAQTRALELLRFVGLEERAGNLARNLPYGDQRRLEIARALATQPTLLLLDEPAAGMNPSETTDLMKLIARIRDRGVTVVLIEHHMKLVMGISDRIVVLDYGTKIAEGTPAEVRANPRVVEAYLGKEDVG